MHTAFARVRTGQHESCADAQSISAISGSIIRCNGILTRRHRPLEPALADTLAEENVQFERLGYFLADRHDHARA